MDPADRIANSEEHQTCAGMERFYQIAFEKTDTAIFISNPKGHCLVANSRALSLTGYSKGELIGKEILDLFQTSDQALSRQRESFQEGKAAITDGHGARMAVWCRSSFAS